MTGKSKIYFLKHKLNFSIMTVFFCLSIITDTSAGEAVVKSNLLLRNDTVFVGEKPVIIVQIKNNGIEAVSVIKNEERAFAKMVYTFGVVREPVDRGPHERIERQPWKRPDDYIFLEPGDSKIYRFTSSNYPLEGGKHVVRFSFNPLQDTDMEIKSEKFITAYKLTKHDIIARHRIEYRSTSGTEEIDFLNVITRSGNELIFRRQDQNGQIKVIKRLEKIKPDTRFLAVPLLSHKSNSRDKILLAYNLRGVLFVLNVDNKGEVIEKKKLIPENGSFLLKDILEN